MEYKKISVKDLIDVKKYSYGCNNVIDTGITYYAANRLLGGRMNPLVFAMV